jgi:TM2 domain-containing membrane protein YozV
VTYDSSPGQTPDGQQQPYQQPYQQPTQPDPAYQQPYQSGYQQPQPGFQQPPQPGYQQPGYPQSGYQTGQPAYGQQLQSLGVDAYGRPLSDKSKLVAGLLGIFLGVFGVGRFYMGDTKTGVLQLVVSICTGGIGGIWGFIDGIIILVNGGVDGQGRRLRD